MSEDSSEDSSDVPLSMATFDQIADELGRRSIGCLVTALYRVSDNEEHTYCNYYGRVVAIGLAAKAMHSLLNQPSRKQDPDFG